MVKEKKLTENITEKIIWWQVWKERSFSFVWAAIGLAVMGLYGIGLGLGIGLFMAIAAYGGSWSMEQFHSNIFTKLAILCGGLGMLLTAICALLALIGVIPSCVTLVGYGYYKRNILKSKEREELIVDSLINRVQNMNYGKYAAVISILGDIGNKRATSVIIPALKDENDEVREKAADALGKIGDARAVEPLIFALKDGIRVREKAADALDKLSWKPVNDTEKAYYLIAKKKWDELVRFGEPAVELLIHTLKDRDKDARKNATEALGKIGNVKAIEPLTLALKDEDENVRKVAKEALEKIKAEKS